MKRGYPSGWWGFKDQDEIREQDAGLHSSTKSFTHSISEPAIGKLRAPVHLRLGQCSGTSGLLRGVLNTIPETGMLTA